MVKDMAAETDQQMPKRGIVYALIASVLFGLTTPLSKGLVSKIDPQLLAGLFYLGSGIGLSVLFAFKKLTNKRQSVQKIHFPKLEWSFLGPAILAGGVFAPVLLMVGLVSTPGSTASLLLNIESVFTAFIAWFVFKENYDKRIFIGMLAIVAGGAVLSMGSSLLILPSVGCLLIIAACLCWAIDNNLTRKVSAADALLIATLKGLVAGVINTGLALFYGKTLPSPENLMTAFTVGFLGYGVSLVLYVLALRHIGAARTGAYFAVAPFLGAAISLLVFHEAITTNLFVAGVLMGLGLWLHLTEHHSHEHVHNELKHAHEHVHDEHHQHEHSPEDPPGEPHVHSHKHEHLIHHHPHFPDQDHFHEH